MANTKVANVKAPIKPSEDQFNDRDKLNDLLVSYKHLTYLYSIACQEASNTKLYKEFLRLFEQASKMQRDTYDLMFENGWYALEKQTPEKIKQQRQMYSQQKSQLA